MNVLKVLAATGAGCALALLLAVGPDLGGRDELTLAAPAEPAALEITWYTTDAGGVQTSTGGTLSLSGTAGQVDAGRASNGGYTLWSGFWSGTMSASELPAILVNLPAVFRLPANP